MRINNNVAAMNIYRNQQQTNNSISKSLNKLSSGQRINHAGDDASGLAISEKMRAQIRGLEQADKNIDIGISLIQVADAGLGEIIDPKLMRLRELVIRAASDSLSDADRQFIKQEIDQVLSGIDDIATLTEFSTIKLLNSSSGGGISTGQPGEISLQVGPNAGQQFKIQLTDVSHKSLKLDPLEVDSHANATSALQKVDDAISQASSERSKFGSYQNALEHIGNNVKNYKEILTNAESRIRDVDFAAEITKLSSHQVILQSAQAMMTKANQISQGILEVLK